MQRGTVRHRAQDVLGVSLLGTMLALLPKLHWAMAGSLLSPSYTTLHFMLTATLQAESLSPFYRCENKCRG